MSEENREIRISLPEPAPESEPSKDLDHETRLIRLEEKHRLEMERLDREMAELRGKLAALLEESPEPNPEPNPAPEPEPNPGSEELALPEELVEVIPPEEEPEEEEIEEEPEPRSRNLPWYL